jgi:ribonuclease HI
MTQGRLDLDDGVGAGIEECTLYCDGGARGNPGPAAIGAVVYDTSVVPPRRLATVSEALGVATNNVAEYEALIRGLEAALPFRPGRLLVRADSQLVVKQLRGEYRVRQPHLRPLFDRARALLAQFAAVDLGHVPRAENTEADALVNAALDGPGSAARG